LKSSYCLLQLIFLPTSKFVLLSALTMLETRVLQKPTVNYVCGQNDYETWVSFLNVETKERSKQWMHIFSPGKLRKFKLTLFACQKANGSRFLWEERSSDVRIHPTRDHNSVASVLLNTKKLFRAIKNKKVWNADIWCSVLLQQCKSLEHCWSISTGNWLLKALTSLRDATTCLPT
jgi:hypothetical protein